jgi:hypothetical protein
VRLRPVERQLSDAVMALDRHELEGLSHVREATPATATR